MAKKTKKVYSVDNLKKSNILIQSKYKTTAFANKIIAIGLYHIQKGEYTYSKSGGNIVCEITVAELRDRLGRTGNSLYRDIDKTSKRLLKYQLGYRDSGKKEFRYINLFTEMQYAGGVYAITFNGDLKAYLNELQDNYTLLNLPLMLRWQREYTFRLYELLMSNEYMFEGQGYQCEVEYGLAEFKFTIGVYDIDDDSVKSCIKGVEQPDFEQAEEMLSRNKSKNKEEKQFVNWTDFKRSFIEPAVKEINATKEAGMIIDDVEPLKKGRGAKVYAVKFKYRTRVNEAEDEAAATVMESNESRMSEDDKFYFEIEIKENVLKQYKLPITDVRAICSVADYDKEKIVNASQLLSQQSKTIENVTGWILSCIKDNYVTSKKIANNRFDNFEQREYAEKDLKDLENKLLGID